MNKIKMTIRFLKGVMNKLVRYFNEMLLGKELEIERPPELIKPIFKEIIQDGTKIKDTLNHR